MTTKLLFSPSNEGTFRPIMDYASPTALVQIACFKNPTLWPRNVIILQLKITMLSTRRTLLSSRKTPIIIIVRHLISFILSVKWNYFCVILFFFLIYVI